MRDGLRLHRTIVTSNIVTMPNSIRRSPLALAILVLLYEEPMHPYRMQQLIKERAKDEVINVRLRASLYQTITRLLRDGLIAVQSTARSENRPERTIYRLTEVGRETAFAWLCSMLATPAREFPEFPAAVSFLAMLRPEEALAQLETRVGALEAELAEIGARLGGEAAVLPRVVVLEEEYRHAVRQAELAWVQDVIVDLRSGALTWNLDQLREFAASFAAARSERPGR
jgi:DNA-binding PadR family transcriptional regulator